jgi:hypothetical protein
MVDQPIRKVFYSWQSDLPNNTNRGFIERALEQAITAIAKSGVVEMAAVDRDTAGVAGSPNIASTIFGKIASATAFVADISIVNPAPRATPNPNVLIELGYAFHCLGEERVVLVFNQACGSLDDVPFDLRQHRILSYSCRENDDKATVRAMLAANLESQLRSIFALKARGQVDVRVIVQRSVSAAGPDVFRGITVEVQNHSSTTIFLNNITFPCAKGGSLFPQRAYNGANEPNAIQPGNNHLLLFREDEFVEWAAQHGLVAAAATDKIGRKWTSDPAAFQKLLGQIRRDREGKPAEPAGD